MYESDRESLKQAKGGEASRDKNGEQAEKSDFFPALQKYKDEHNTANLQKLMVEISEFCRAVYASTRNDAERKIYHSMIEKLNK